MNKPNGGDPIVTAFGKSAPVHMHKYPLSYRFAQTERFAECNPFFNYEGIPKDKDIILYTGSSVDTMSLNAPILQDIRKNMDYYLIDKHAILPHCYDYIKNQPTHGDDIDASLANCLMPFYSDDNWGLVDASISIIADAAFFDVNGDAIYDDTTFTFSVFLKFMKALAWLNEHFSDDSLFAQFRIPLADYIGRRKEFLAILDDCWKLYHDILENQAVALESDGVDSPFSVDFMDSDNNIVHRARYDWHNVSDRLQMYYDFLDNPNIKLSSNDYWDPEFASGEYPRGDSLVVTYFVENGSAFSALFNSSNLEKPLNIEKLLSYQLCMAEFQSNDKIDFVFSADIFRRIYESVALAHNLVFDYNGENQPYDGFSRITFEHILNYVVPNLHYYDLWMQLITKKRSLRYIDYFCGVRPTPLAVGDYNVAVNNNVASVIDITEKIQFARLGLAVNRVGRKAKDYLRGIFGSKERVDVCCPVKIGHTDCMLYQEVTQNTAADQLELDNSRTSVLKSREKRFAFNTDCDVDSIILGITSYEITRFYEKGLDPFALKVDRFDMFNPFLQYIGDQPVQSVELNAENNVGDIWGYNSRHIEYKAGCAVDYCVGGFRNDLSGWIFKQPDLAQGEFINPDFIRAHQNELDRYYVALTGTTPTKRYHFICKYNNYVSATRNMVKAPQILGL